MKQRDSFIFYRSFYEAMNGLNNEQKAELLTAICEYSLNFNEIELSGITASLFTLIKPNLEANNQRFINGSKSKREAKRKQNGSKPEANKDKDKDKDKDVNKDVNKDVKKGGTSPFKSLLLSHDISEDLADAFIAYRKNNKQVLTEHSLTLIINQANIAGWNLRDAIEEIMLRGWKGVKADWLMNTQKPNPTKKKDFKKSIGL